jgi:hypothetical protein
MPVAVAIATAEAEEGHDPIASERKGPTALNADVAAAASQPRRPTENARGAVAARLSGRMSSLSSRNRAASVSGVPGPDSHDQQCAAGAGTPVESLVGRRRTAGQVDWRGRGFTAVATNSASSCNDSAGPAEH